MASLKPMIAVTVMSIITTRVPAQILAWREFRIGEMRLCPDKPTSTPLSDQSLIKTYPGYFRTAEQQATFERVLIYNNTVGLMPVNTSSQSNNITPVDCGFQCQQPMRRKRQATSIYHGCCQSSMSFITPVKLKDTESKIRRVVQYPVAKQYFMQDDCVNVAGCSGTVCSDGIMLVSAVVYKGGILKKDADDIEDTEVDMFYIKGCCKSVNI